MFDFQPDPAQPKPEMYRELVESARALTHGERDGVANMANLAALIWQFLPALNWAGFYRVVGGELVLGPFMGKPACIRIAFGQGCAARRRPAGRPSWCPMCTPFPAISPATRRAGRNWWCRYCVTAR